MQQEVAVAALTKTALAPEIAEHIRTCPDCAAERARLEPTAALLANVSADEVRPSQPPNDDLFLQRLLRAAAAEKRGRRRRAVILSIGGAAAAIVIGVAAVFAVSAQQARNQVQVAQASATENGVHATALISPAAGGGSQVKISLGGVKPGTHCVLRAVTNDAGPQVIAVWDAGYDGTAIVDGSIGSPPQAISSIEVAQVNGPTLVTIPVTT